jgi:hypothetical protein
VRKRREQAGFTLVEAAVTFTFVCILFGSLVTAINSASESFATGVVASDVGQRSERIVYNLADILKFANPETIYPRQEAPFSTTKIQFQRLVGYQDGKTVWGQTEAIGLSRNQVVWITQDPATKTKKTRVLCSGIATALEGEKLGNNKDDNGNGLVDERGLNFSFSGNRITIRATVEGLDAKKTRIVQTVTRTVYFRY